MLPAATVQIRELSNLEALRHFAEEVAAQIRSDDILLLVGDLGAGKTTFIRFLTEILHSEGDSGKAASPTYALHHRYENLNKTWILDHWDLYRVKNLSELDAAGFWEILEYEKTLVAIEWPERIDEANWPQSRRRWSFHFHGEGLSGGEHPKMRSCEFRIHTP